MQAGLMIYLYAYLKMADVSLITKELLPETPVNLIMMLIQKARPAIKLVIIYDADCICQISEGLEPKIWVARYLIRLYNFAVHKVSDRQLTDDLRQNTFISALENLDRFERGAQKKHGLKLY